MISLFLMKIAALYPKKKPNIDAKNTTVPDPD
jgi:hypothetical protein